jgi:hypothetical protein
VFSSARLRHRCEHTHSVLRLLLQVRRRSESLSSCDKAIAILHACSLILSFILRCSQRLPSKPCSCCLGRMMHWHRDKKLDMQLAESILAYCCRGRSDIGRGSPFRRSRLGDIPEAVSRILAHAAMICSGTTSTHAFYTFSLHIGLCQQIKSINQSIMFSLHSSMTRLEPSDLVSRCLGLEFTHSKHVASALL